MAHDDNIVRAVKLLSTPTIRASEEPGSDDDANLVAEALSAARMETDGRSKRETDPPTPVRPSSWGSELFRQEDDRPTEPDVPIPQWSSDPFWDSSRAGSPHEVERRGADWSWLVLGALLVMSVVLVVSLVCG